MIPRKTLGRTNREFPAIAWEIPANAASAVAGAAAESELFVAAHPVPALPAHAALVLTVDAVDLLEGGGGAVTPLLAATNRARADAVLLTNLTPTDLKGGRLYHRLTQLRDARLTDLVFLEAADAPAAEWMADNSPAHAIVLPYSVADQSARYRVFVTAAEAACALIARPGPTDDDLRLCLSEPAFAATIVPLPTGPVRLAQVASYATTPDPAFRDQSWTTYTATHEPPPKLRGAHPPEYGA